MTNRAALLQELQSDQIAQFYTGIKVIAYLYQILIMWLNLALIFNYGIFSRPKKGLFNYNGSMINVYKFEPIAIGMIFELFFMYPIVIILQFQIFKAILSLKDEANLGSNFIDNMGVRIRNVSSSTGSVNLSEIQQSANTCKDRANDDKSQQKISEKPKKGEVGVNLSEKETSASIDVSNKSDQT